MACSCLADTSTTLIASTHGSRKTTPALSAASTYPSKIWKTPALRGIEALKFAQATQQIKAS